MFDNEGRGAPYNLDDTFSGRILELEGRMTSIKETARLVKYGHVNVLMAL